MKKFWKKLKAMYFIYKNIEVLETKAKSKPQKMSDIHVRPDYCAFLTCPRPVIKSEIIK